MITKKHFYVTLFLLLMIPSVVYAQGRKYTVSGTITDSMDGEDLAGAGIQVKGTSLGTVTNAYGFYSLSLTPGEYTLLVSYIGYTPKEIPVSLSEDTRLNITLNVNTSQLEEIVVTAEARNSNITNMEMGMEKLSVKEIKAIPALMGEVDVIKAIQLLPGVQSTSEGSSGFSVRGGKP